MKAAILGTTDYHATMQQIAQNALQRMGGYKPQIAVESPNILPVEKRYAQNADAIVQEFTQKPLVDCNPRSPYLFLTWLFVGLDNDYRLMQPQTHRCLPLARLVLKIALGHLVSGGQLSHAGGRVSHEFGMYSAREVVWVAYAAGTNRDAKKAVQSAISRISNDVLYKQFNDYAINLSDENHPDHAAMKVIREQVREYFAKKMQEWAYISDEEAGLIARQLLFDILDAGKENS